ncbi:MAG: alpha/beta fold hydrolase [Chloroflexi bacterium]|nr:alpha/beta fold hydrolase [Chloroflexota bacterium]
METRTKWRESHAATVEIGVRALGPGFQAKRPDMAMLYMQVSRTNPPRPASASAAQTDGPMAADLGKMKIPTLFIVGDDDELTPPHVIELAAKYIPGARLTRVPEAGHSVYFEKPDVFNFEMNRFLKSL